MTTALIRKDSTVMTFGAQVGYTPEYVQLIKDTYAREATDNELQMFLEVCHSTKLNPFNKEIYFWKQSGKVIIHTGIDGYRLIADRTGTYAPGKPIKRTMDDNGNHIASTAYVMKLVAGKWFEIEETARIDEWKKDSPFWKDRGKASHQLDITAERHALRKAFPRSIPAVLGVSGPGGPEYADTAAEETAEEAERRGHLTDCLLGVGRIFCSNEQFATLEAQVKAAALPVLEERHTNALVKLREHVLTEIGTKLHGEAYSAFFVKALPQGIDAAECFDLFSVLDKLTHVEPGEIVETPIADAQAAPEPPEEKQPPTTPEVQTSTEEDEERAAIVAESEDKDGFAAVTVGAPGDGLDSKTEDLRIEVTEMFDNLPQTRQKDVLLGKPSISTSDFEQLKALKVRISNDDLPV